ncbi:MAG: peroxidase [Pseudomonadota bacterium]
MAGQDMSRARTYPARPVDFADMQGLVRFGHGRLVEAEFLLLSVTDVAAARHWLATAPVTSAETLEEPPDVALQIAFTATGLRALGLADDFVAQFSQPFLAGMAGEQSRARRLGDTGTNAPEHWHWDAAGSHVLLMLYARAGGLDDFRSTVLEGEFETAFGRVQTLTTRSNDGIEPFGFADGISEPKVDWEQAHPPSKHGREAYENMIAPGEVVLGHINEYNEVSPAPQLTTSVAGADVPPTQESPQDMRDFGGNGSYLVLRQLEQDVAGFWRYLDDVTDGDPTERAALAAAMVGRQQDGTPLVRGRRDIVGGRHGNNFTFDDDIDGVVCPVGAHIRRANPRTGDQPPGVDGVWSWILSTLGFRRRRDKLPGRHDLVASTRFHRLVRRGRAYGPKLSPEDALTNPSGAAQGLHFICLCANLTRQFEFVQNAWMSAPGFNGLRSEADPLVGSRAPVGGVPSDSFSIQRATGIGRRYDNLPQFVTVRGGGYFFLPGLRALRFIARQKD